MDKRKACLVTAQQLHACFAQLKHRRPNVDLCAELAEQINQCGPIFVSALHAMQSDFAAAYRKDLAEATRDGRRFAQSLRRLEPGGENHLIIRPTEDERLLAMLTKWIEPRSQWQFSQAKSHLWIAYGDAFTPYIVATLRKAGWRRISMNSDTGPVTAALSLLIGAVTGAEPPGQASLGRTLRAAKSAEPGRKTRRKKSSIPSDVLRREHA